MRELMWQYPVASTWLVCAAMLVLGTTIIVAVYALKQKDADDE